jgi:hypothetical protein
MTPFIRMAIKRLYLLAVSEIKLDVFVAVGFHLTEFLLALIFCSVRELAAECDSFLINNRVNLARTRVRPLLPGLLFDKHF